MGRALSCLLILAAVSCSEPAEVAPPEETVPSGSPASSTAEYAPTDTAGELAFLASRVCVPQVTKEGGVLVADLQNSLTENGYTAASSQISRQLFGRVLPGFVAARKKSELGRFLVAFGEGLPACVVLLTDDSTTPPVKDLRRAFESEGWTWTYMAAVRPDRLPYAGFTRTDTNGKTILAVARDEPESDRTVRLGIDISYTDF